MDRIHILQIIDSLKVGGAEVLLRELVQGLPSERYRITTCYSTPGPLEIDMAAMGAPLFQVPRLARVDPLLVWRLWQIMRRDPPHIVHTHLFKSDFHGRLAARLCGVPIVISTLHSTDAWALNPVWGRIYGATARWADRLIAVSEEVRAHAITHTFVSPERVHTIPNGVPLRRFHEQEAAGQGLRQQLGLASDAPLIGIVGRLVPQKGHTVFLRAARQILQALPQARFVIVGDGPLYDSLVAQAAESGLSQAAIFTGLRKDIPAIMAAIDLLVLASHFEGLPVALLEGMAAARPVVATAVGGIPGVLIEGVTGLLVPPNEPEMLAQACVRILNDPELQKQFGAAGRARAEAHYSLEAMIRQTIEQYEELLRLRGMGSMIRASSLTGDG